MSTATTVATQELEKRFNRVIGASATNLCTHCGWCIEACHVYLATGDPMTSPVAKAERIRSVYKYTHDPLSRLLPSWTGAKKLTDAELDDWVNVAFRDCTLCERCVVNCPLSVETPAILAAARGALTAAGKAPEILDQLADAAIVREEMMDTFHDFFVEQIQALEEEVQERLGDPDARIPVEQEADILYVPLSGAHTIVPQALVFNTVGASWSLSVFDASNYAFFLADVPRAKQITERILKEAKRINAKEIVLSECGHAYSVLRWEAPKWFGGELPYRVRSIVELLDEYIDQSLLQLDPSRNVEPVTYHDPCNLGRKGGVFEQPRRVLQAVTMDYREMTPNREENFCCGGGSGMVANLDWEEDRLLYGEPKANQIRETGARVIATSCDNCLHQIRELGEHYELGTSCCSVTELVANALIVNGRKPEHAPTG